MKKIKASKAEYVQIRLKNDTAYSYQFILDKYGVSCDFLKNSTDGGGKILIGFNTELQEKFITEFLNQGYELISVSEDEKSICFHMIHYID